MDHELNYLASLKKFGDWEDGNKKWIQLYPYDSWDHPFYGTTTIDKEVAQKFVDNFNNHTRGTEIHSDYEHGEDAAKGSKASGKFLQVEARDDGPWALVEFTEEAKKEIDAGEWNYWSTSHWDTWTHPHTGETHEYVLDGGGLTNKPFVKSMVPLNFSEIILENPELKRYAVLGSAQRNDLPDSAFLYVEPDGKKDALGKTEPRSLRHLPYKNSEGKVDHAHLVNAKSRLSQSGTGTSDGESWLTDSLRSSLLARCNNMLKSYSETLIDIGLMSSSEVNALFDTEPVPALDNDLQTDEEGMDELLKKFRELFGLEETVDEEGVLKYASDMQIEIEPLRELQKNSEQKKAFSESFPDEAQELVESRKYRQEQEAKVFSESLASRRVTRKVKVEDSDDTKDESTGLGLSALAVESAGEVIKKLSEGTATVVDFKQFTEAILDNGIVDYSTKGSSREDETELDNTEFADSDTPLQVRKKFSEKLQKLATDEFEGNLTKAYVEAQERWPEEFAEYRNRKPVAA
jgi:FtsZ-interacting cell division protein YlmF